MTIEKKGEAKLSVRAGPDAGSRVETNITPPAQWRDRASGTSTVDIRAEARLADRANKSGRRLKQAGRDDVQGRINREKLCVRSSICAAAAAALALTATPAPGPEPPRPAGRARPEFAARCRRCQGSDQPDVCSTCPTCRSSRSTLEVDNLQVHIALDARLANLLKLTAGADASIDKVKIDDQGRPRPGDPDRPARQCPRDHRADAADARQQPAAGHAIALDRRQYGQHGRRGGQQYGRDGRRRSPAPRCATARCSTSSPSGLTEVSQTVNASGQTVRQVPRPRPGSCSRSSPTAPTASSRRGASAGTRHGVSTPGSPERCRSGAHR